MTGADGTRGDGLRNSTPLALSSPLIKSLCRRGRVIVAEDKARNRVESSDSGRERNAVMRSQEPAAARMDFFNGLLAGGVLNGRSGIVIASDVRENYISCRKATSRESWN